MQYNHLLLLADGPCNPNPCQNGGKCTGEGSTYRCECLSGFAGDNCEGGWFSEECYIYRRHCYLNY